MDMKPDCTPYTLIQFLKRDSECLSEIVKVIKSEEYPEYAMDSIYEILDKYGINYKEGKQ